jgi:hypothetical protein
VGEIVGVGAGVGDGVGTGVGVGTGDGVGVGVGVAVGLGEGLNVLGRAVAWCTVGAALGDGVAACPDPQAIRNAEAMSAKQRKTKRRTRQAYRLAG